MADSEKINVVGYLRRWRPLDHGGRRWKLESIPCVLWLVAVDVAYPAISDISSFALTISTVVTYLVIQIQKKCLYMILVHGV